MAIFEKTPACKTRNHWIYLTENTKTCRMRGRAGLAKSLHVLDLTGVYFHPKIKEYSEKVCLLTGRGQTRSSSLVALVKQYCTRLHTVVHKVKLLKTWMQRKHLLFTLNSFKDTWQFFREYFFVFILIRFEQKLVLFFIAHTTARMNEPLFNGALRPQVRTNYDVLFIAVASFMLMCIWTITTVIHIYVMLNILIK